MRISVPLSAEGFAAAAKAIRGYASTLPAKADALGLKVAERGRDAAKDAVRIRSGKLRSSLAVEGEGGSYAVTAQSDHAAFVEFGTGVKGSGTYKGRLPEQWEYDTQRTPSAHFGPNGEWWAYYDEDQERIVATRGQKANGYMAQGAEAMRAAVRETAKEVFGSD